MPGSQLKEKMFKCLGQGHKNKENRETHTNSKLPVYKETKIHTLQNSIISILKLPGEKGKCRQLFLCDNDSSHNIPFIE